MKAVILAGGSGSRLWPLSRDKSPKQLHKLISNKTMLEETIDRLDFLEPEDIYIATNKKYEEEVKSQAKRIPDENFIIEPAMRDTATCIGFAAAYIAKNHPHETMAVIYSDQYIKEKKTFQEKLQVADKIARKEGTINIIEVKALYPSTSYGYVMIGEALDPVDGHEVYSFEKFIEKPNVETAKKLVESFKYMWNTGLYVWRLDTIMDAYAEFMPDTYKRLMKMMKSIEEDWAKPEIKQEYEACKKISIDYGIMEKLNKKNVRIIPAYLGWSDIGTWKSLYDELTKNPEANVQKGKTLVVDTESSLIYNYSKKLVAAFGVKDIVVVETDDALLICDKNRTSDLKDLLKELSKTNKELL
ncbi:MAG: sugar phosphate nucleotidyltransferase [Candidatus Peregrinibacteria bacterium]|nr:sugar phosphate nucleotidyltransferase [Candidatus Peregrinibacteria bacterium]MDZ4244873.1 sugar phosphate nucleotidyltransferase [Candidatus Gracilibacteria bacterium]